MQSPGLYAFMNDRMEEARSLGEEVVEIPLLLPAWQAEALEMMAYDHGLTAAEMVRHLLAEYLRGLSR